MPTRHATASAPPGIGNLGPGLDVLGCAIEGAPDVVTATWSDLPGVTVIDPGHPDLPHSPNAAGIAADAALRHLISLGAVPTGAGVSLRVRKGIPLSAGQAGSAASAVAGAAAVNALAGTPLTPADVMAAALESESRLAGRHLDNIAPAVLGGIVLVRGLSPIDAIRLPVPPDLHFAMAHPAYTLRTADARAALPRSVDLSTVTTQLAQVAAMVDALHRGDVEAFGRHIDDGIAEPARLSLLPGFASAKRAALAAGAFGASISGAGPTIFAACRGAQAANIAEAMRRAYESEGIAAQAWVTRPGPGVQITTDGA